MPIHLNKYYDIAYKTLNIFKLNFSQEDYPTAIFKNINLFKLSLFRIWDTELNNSFTKYANTQKDIFNSIQVVFSQYLKEEKKLIDDEFLYDSLIGNKLNIGDIDRNTLDGYVSNAKNGNKKDLEELEFCYLYHYVTNVCVIHYAAFGRIGQNKNQALLSILGGVIAHDEISFTEINKILGNICVASFLQKLYIPLSNDFKDISKTLHKVKFENIDFNNFSFIAPYHFRFQNNKYVSGPDVDSGTERIIKIIKTEIEEFYSISILNNKNSFVLRPKPMRRLFNDSNTIFFQGYGLDSNTNENFSNYGMTIINKEGFIEKIIFHRLDTKIDYQYFD